MRLLLDALLLVPRKLLGDTVEEEQLSLLVLLVPLREALLAEVSGVEGHLSKLGGNGQRLSEL